MKDNKFKYLVLVLAFVVALAYSPVVKSFAGSDSVASKGKIKVGSTILFDKSDIENLGSQIDDIKSNLVHNDVSKSLDIKIIPTEINKAFVSQSHNELKTNKVIVVSVKIGDGYVNAPFFTYENSTTEDAFQVQSVSFYINTTYFVSGYVGVNRKTGVVKLVCNNIGTGWNFASNFNIDGVRVY